MKNIVFIGALLMFLSAKAQINTSPAGEPQSGKIETKDKYKPKGVVIDKFLKRENLMVGGGFGLGLSNLFFSVGLAPEVSYFVWPERVAIGTRFNYNYYRDNFYDVNSHLFGGGPFMRGYIWKGLFAQAEYELTSVEVILLDAFGNYAGKQRGSLNAFLVGGGFHQNFDSGFGFYFQILFNTLQNTDFIYPNPSYRTGFTYRFNAK